MENIIINDMEELTIKLLHYFITDQGYSPIILQGAKNEIWLENLDSDYKIIRIVSDYIHNDEQFNFDIYRSKEIMKKIKRKTLSLSMNALSIFINLGENVHNDILDDNGNITCVAIKSIAELDKYKVVIEEFPNITVKANKYTEKGISLFMKLTSDINKKSAKDAKEAERLFKPKKPIVTYVLMGINIIFYIISSILSKNIIENDPNVLYYMGGIVNNGQWWRLFTAIFLHGGLFHLIFNNYALYVIGPQIENFFGKYKFIIIYIVSGVIGNLLSMLFLADNNVGIGASGAIFGLLGSILYFGYHYRIYLDGVLKKQIIPIIILNLGLSLILNNVDIFAHVGGLIGGVLISMAVGVDKKSSKDEKINGIILTAIIICFLVYLNFFK